jgi:hypothetical protein
MYKEGDALVGEPSNLIIEPQSRLTLLLSDFQLAFLILADVGDLDLATESSKGGIFCIIDRLCQLRNLFLKRIIRCLGLGGIVS